MNDLNRQKNVNVDEKGNVLFLDRELLDRKEVGFPPYRNKPNGLGINNWILNHVLYMDDKRWPLWIRQNASAAEDA